MPFSCAASSASAICRAMRSASSMEAVRGREPLGERVALDEFEHEGADAIGLLDAVNGADVRVIQRRQHSRFAIESREPVSIRGEDAMAGP